MTAAKSQSKLDNAVRYHLRVSLHPRYWREEEWALLAIVRNSQADEVAFFVPHSEESSPGLGTDAQNRDMVRRLAPLFARLHRQGVAPSINIYWTVGFSQAPSLPRDLRSRFAFRWAVGIEGRQSIALACPQDRAWRDHVTRMYRTFAKLKPARLWLDDDVRMTLRADLHCPCFCEMCLAEMTRRTGQEHSREQWVQAILADPPNAVRGAWLDFQEELQRNLVAELSQAVHQVSPQTDIGLMFSPLEIHWAEGRRWEALLVATGTPRPYVRPNIAPYVETTGPAIAAGFNNTRLTQAVLPAHVRHATEIDDYPCTRHFSKSAALVRASLIMGQALGIREATFALYRPSGRLDLEIRRDNVWERLLAETKPFLRTIAALDIRGEQMRGVSLLWHEDVCRHVRGVAGQSKPIFLYRERPLDQLLPLLGIATRYGPGSAAVCTGEQISCLSDGELDALLAGGVLLDARAAEELLHRGKGALAGLVRRKADAPVVVETIEDAEFGDLAGDAMSCRWLPGAWQFQLARGVRVISRLRDYEGRETGHGLALFENRLGGRVAVLPFDSQVREVSALGITYPPLVSPSLLTWPRQAQLRAVLAWLNNAPLPLFIAAAPLAYPLLIEQDRRQIVVVANLSPDRITNLTFELAAARAAAGRVWALKPDGAWRRRPAKVTQKRQGVLTVKSDVTVDYLDVAVLRLEESGD